MSRKELLEPVDAKLRRATGQIALVATNAKDWSERTKIEAISKLLPERKGYELIASAFDLALVEELGLIVGECLHNLRSSLDNLFYGLACLRNDPPIDPRSLQFPICETQAAYNSRSVARSIEQLSDATRQKLERIQPFQRSGVPGDGLPADDPLLLLHALNISDKHRVPIGVNLVPTEMSFTAAVQFETEEGAAANVPPKAEIILPLRPSAAFFRWATTHPLTIAEGSFAIQGKLSLISDRALLDLEPTLLLLLKHVTLVRDYFASDFE